LKSAPARVEKMSSPAPIVSEAMIAPGPKRASHLAGFAVRNDGGGAAATGEGLEFNANAAG
jgi:hypothetical protein